MLKKVRISITTTQRRLEGSLFEEYKTQGAPRRIADEEPQEISLVAEGSYYDDGHRVTVSYRESELSGMEGTKSSIGFHKHTPTCLTLKRDGAVRTALVFEEGQEHLCYYQTPVMPMEVAVRTSRVANTLEQDGKLSLDYIIEIKGADPEETHFTLTIQEYKKITLTP